MIYPLLLLLSDFVALLCAFTLSYILRVQIDDSPLVREIEAITFIKVFILLFPIWLLVNGMLGLYAKRVYEKRLPEFGRLLGGAFIGILIIIGFDFLRDETIFPARLVPVYGFLLAFFFLASFRNILWMFRRYMFRYGYGVRGVMVIGSTDASEKLVDSLRPTLSSGYTIRAIVGNKTIVPKDYTGKHFSTIEDALRALPKLSIHTVIQTEFYANPARNERIFAAVRNNHLQYKFIPAQSDFYTGKNTVEILFGFPVISVHQTPLVGWGRIIKRLMDFVLSLLALIPAIPLMLILGVIIKLTDFKGPIIYKHRRVTRFGNEFYVYKLRSMYWKYSTGDKASRKSDADVFREMGREDLVKEFEKNQKVKDDPRIMAIGKPRRTTPAV